MTHGTEQHLEHAEHAQHAAHDPFDKRVAVSMAMVAAVLAFVSTLSHRAHNQTLQLQGEAIRLQSKAATTRTEESDKWNYFQAKKERGYRKADNVEIAKYNRYLIEGSNKHMVAFREEDSSGPSKGTGEKKDKKPAREKSKKPPDNPADLPKHWASLARAYAAEAKGLEQEARQLKEEAEKLNHQAGEELHKSHHAHAQANRLDMGHLGLEMALVLCSVAVLSKQRGFWYTGIAVGVIGACVSLTAYVPFLM
jgi:hypothetical protein